MDSLVRSLGWVGFGAGTVVLLAYASNWSDILASSVAMAGWRIKLWMVSACLTATCFLALMMVWALEGNKVTGNDRDARLFVVGLWVFITGAVLWPTYLRGTSLTPTELASLWTTAAGSILMFTATVHEPMSLPLTSVLMFHHVFVDGIWWPQLDRRWEWSEWTNVAAMGVLMAALAYAMFQDKFLSPLLTLIPSALLQLYPKTFRDPPRYFAGHVLIFTGAILAILCLVGVIRVTYVPIMVSFVGNLMCLPTPTREP